MRGQIKANFFPIVLCLSFFGFWLVLLFYKYSHFNYYDWDLAFFAQAMWNLCHGSSYVSIFDLCFFANHANVIAFFLVPLYKIFPHPMTLVVLKLLSWTAGGYVLYLIAKEHLGAAAGTIFLLLFFFYPANIFGMIYEFDFEALAVVFLVLMYYGFVKERWALFLISSCIVILTKENLPLIVFAFGIYGFFVKKDKLKWGLVPAFLGAASFLFLTQVFVPWMGGNPIGQHPYIGHYKEFGSSLPQVATGIMTHPIKVWQTMDTPLNARWFFSTMGQFGLLPFLSPQILGLILPIALQHLFSSAWQQHSIYYGYALTLAPFIFLAAIQGMVFIKRRFHRISYRVIFCILIMTAGLSLGYHLDGIRRRYLPRPEIPSDQVNGMIQKIPENAGVIASFHFLANLSQREDLYAFYKVYRQAYAPFKIPSRVKYALIDLDDPWLLDSSDSELRLKRKDINAFFKHQHWVAKDHYGSITLYQR